MNLKQAIIASSLLCNVALSNPNIHYIGPGHGGMFSSINKVLYELLWCEQNNKIPVVMWDQRSRYYEPAGFNGKKNVWEYYFQPINPLNAPFPSHEVPKLAPNYNSAHIFANEFIDQQTRNLAQKIIDKYIKLNTIVQTKIDNFYQQFIAGKKTVGIHLRGTDKYKEAKLVSPEQIIAVALEAADKDAQFFIASDEKWRFERMKGLLENEHRTVIFYDCHRAEWGIPLHVASDQSCSISGEDVIVEVMLLSKCNLLVHTFSNVSTGALYWNASLKNIRV